MILVDTCVWVEHLRGRRRARELRTLLDEDRVLVHPWIIGELSLGRLGGRRRAILRDLSLLPAAATVGDGEVMEMIEARSLAGTGIGWVDAQLIAAALVSGARLWTFDADLDRAARALDAAH